MSNAFARNPSLRSLPMSEVNHLRIDVNDIEVFNREAGTRDAPLVLAAAWVSVLLI
jgi:hypothetical protein